MQASAAQSIASIERDNVGQTHNVTSDRSENYRFAHLVEQIQKGDGDAARQFFEEFKTAIDRICLNVVRTHSTDPRENFQHYNNVEDLSQNFILKVLSPGGISYCPEKSGFKKFIFTVVKDALIDKYRQTMRQTKGEPLSLDAPTSEDFGNSAWTDLLACPVNTGREIHYTLEQRERTGKLHELINVLSDRDRQVLCLRYLYEIPIKEVAAIVEEKENQVKSICRRALDRISELAQSDRFKDLSRI